MHLRWEASVGPVGYSENYTQRDVKEERCRLQAAGLRCTPEAAARTYEIGCGTTLLLVLPLPDLLLFAHTPDSPTALLLSCRRAATSVGSGEVRRGRGRIWSCTGHGTTCGGTGRVFASLPQVVPLLMAGNGCFPQSVRLSGIIYTLYMDSVAFFTQRVVDESRYCYCLLPHVV